MFLAAYFLVLNFMLSISNFIVFWVFMELLMLIFIGLSYSSVTNSFSYLINYFLIQAYASFSILIFYLSSSTLFLTASFLLKLCMFPFHHWFISIGYRLNNFLLVLASTFHNIPVFLMVLFFSIDLSPVALEFSVLLSLLVSSFTMFVSDYRLLLVCSSIGNNSWFFFSSFCNLSTFFLFFIFYFSSFFLAVVFLDSFSKPSLNNNFTCSFYLLSLSGLPPFPVFFANVLVIYQLSFTHPSLFLLLVLLINAFMISSYMYYVFNTLVSNYCNSSSLVFRF